MSYYDKSNNSDKAIQHTREMGLRFSSEIKKSIDKTKIYTSDFNPGNCANNNVDIWIGSLTTTEAVMCNKGFNGNKAYRPILLKNCKYSTSDNIYDNKDNFKVAVLNFASFRHPGGGFINGSFAQEEAICHDSNLYNVISEQKEFYDYNNKHLNDGLYENRALYSPGIKFESEGIIETVDVLTCASPNLSGYLRNGNANLRKNSIALKSRVKFILDILQDNNVTVPILGAFGCGVFRQDANELAQYFKEMIPNYSFDTVVFAIPSKGDNLNKFLRVFK